MKYVVVRVYQRRRLFLDIPFVFPEIVVHSIAYEGFKIALAAQYPGKDGFHFAPLSAGFLNSMDLISISCNGKSSSLGVASRGPADDALIRSADYGSCMQPHGSPRAMPRIRCKATNARGGNCDCGFGQCVKGNVL